MRMRAKSAIVLACGLAMLTGVHGQVQQPPPRGGRGGAPIPFDNFTGFEKIFDGATLTNWDGDPGFWRVEGGAIVGETTADKPLSENTFLIYRGSEPDNFELKLEFRMNATNSGVQYRSRQLTGAVGKWVLCGYQADIDFANQFTGMIYEERGRGFLMQRGQAVEIGPDGVSRQIGSLEMNADELKSLIKPGEWNNVHLIARGNMIMNIVNGHVTAFIVDDDAKGRAMKGLLGFQIHVGPPMKIEFRNIFLKTL